MAKLDFDMEAYSYAEGIKAIRLMFEAAKTTLNLQSNEVASDVAEYERHLDNGGDTIGEWEDGHWLWDQHDVYRLQLMAIEEALVELRLATVISLYHLWERHIPNRSGKRRVHQQLVKDAQSSSTELHRDIDALCYTANYFKHGTDSWRTKLYTEFPERFPKPVKQAQGWSAAFRQLQLNDSDVEWFLEIAECSKREVFKV
jgi:hypothetical protein